MNAFHCVGVTSRYHAPAGARRPLEGNVRHYRDGCDDGGTMPLSRR